MRKMGVDPGMKRVGLALSDEQGELSSPLSTLKRSDDDSLVTAIARTAQEHAVDTIVIGLPLRMNGMEGPEAKRARSLAARVEAASGVKVVLWDERMTTMAAERELRSSGLRGDKKRARIDEAAATLLLQSYLDARQR